MAINLYYNYFADQFPDADFARERLVGHMNWIAATVDLPNSRFRRAVDFYGLVGALEKLAANEGPGHFQTPRGRGHYSMSSIR